MQLFRRISRWMTNQPAATNIADRSASNLSGSRVCRFEAMEPRRVLSASPLFVGAVYIEEDFGADVHGDTFEISFEGGASGTELTRVVIDGDQNNPGFGLGDAFFDTVLSGKTAANNGLGADLSGAFVVVSQNGIDQVTASVVDGTTQLVLDFRGFNAGEKLVFTIDVDEVEEFNPAETDLRFINEGFDPITSGVEFQGSSLTAEFVAANYENAAATDTFRNRYDSKLVNTGLQLSADNADGKRDRTAGAVAQTEQIPKPISIAGNVFHDIDLDLVQDAGESPLANVGLELYVKNGNDYVTTGHVTQTDAAGHYEFGRNLKLAPGVYQVRETQPSGYFSVGAIPGEVNGARVGAVLSDDILTEIAIPLGDTQAVKYDFAESLPAQISGYVYHDRSNDGSRDLGEEGIAGATVQVIAVNTIAPQSTVTLTTDSQGFYQAAGLAPGTYRVVEVQPSGFFDGLDTAGSVAGVVRGSAVNPGDEINAIFLGGGQAGVEYNFGEILPASILGNVHLSTTDGDCFGASTGHAPLENVLVRLFNDAGQPIAETRTDANGDYAFTGLAPGAYTVLEETPANLIDGAERPGVLNGQDIGRIGGNDLVTDILVASGDVVQQVDFCEHLPASISGFVYHDANDSGVRDANEDPISGVTVILLDAAGQEVGRTSTGAAGDYAFTDLRAGEYTLAEVQPSNWVDGTDVAGFVRGSQVGAAVNPGDTIQNISLQWGDQGVEYDFGELLPVSISGYVYHDRQNDGNRDSGDEGLANIAIQVIPVSSSAPQSVVVVATDANGFYQTTGLSPGVYRVVEAAQPSGFVDGIDTAGFVNAQVRGQAINPGDSLENIALVSGESGVEYNFGEYRLASILGNVHLSTTDGDCFGASAGHAPLENVLVRLFNDAGQPIAETRTDANGDYAFTGLAPGAYTVLEETPANLIDGAERTGVLNGQDIGRIGGNDLVTDLLVASGDVVQQVDFCEHLPASISGFVYHDANDSGVRDANEDPISGVTVILLDAAGQEVGRTSTGAAGDYAFTDLHAGEYTLVEVQPSNWVDGTDVAGFVRGSQVGAAVNPGDTIQNISLQWGDQGVEYDFGEFRLGEISGIVHLTTQGACNVNPDDVRLEGVAMQLFDAGGNLVAQTQTDAAGQYRFADLTPGEYTVFEVQPSEYFNVGEIIGDGGGEVLAQDTIGRIRLGSGERFIGYQFCEAPASSISGFVFQDGASILTVNGEAPDNLRTVRDGQLTPDDTRIAGVVLELRNGFEGIPIDGNAALPGLYPSGPIRATTDANGFYEFTGLPRGNYAVYEVHPNGFIDSIDTPGSNSGIAVDATTSSFVLSSLSVNPKNDAILRIALPAGDDAVQNNFSEVVVRRFIPPFNPPEPPSLPPVAPPAIAVSPQIVQLPAPLLVVPPQVPYYGSSSAYTWHLSIINAGSPRGDAISAATSRAEVITQRTGFAHATYVGGLTFGQWQLPADAARNNDPLFGASGATPITGDFNGDGIDEIGVFMEGHWFLDVNGNGRWDAGDLWAKLGGLGDRPVVGDWDGDGKDDIGIFGPIWPGDPLAIDADPGLPDLANPGRVKPKNMPPRPEEAADGFRSMQLSNQHERETQTHLIDHVFKYGAGNEQPVSGDWNGDGISNIGHFHGGQWRLDSDGDGRLTAADQVVQFGQAGDIPIVGDFDGDGVDDLGIFREGLWNIRLSSRVEHDAHLKVFELGGADDVPIVGDFNGDGVDEAGLYHGVNGNASANGAPNATNNTAEEDAA